MTRRCRHHQAADLLQPQERRAGVVMVVKAGCAPRAHQSSGPEHPDAKATVSGLFGILDNPDMVVAPIALASDGPLLVSRYAGE